MLVFHRVEKRRRAGGLRSAGSVDGAMNQTLALKSNDPCWCGSGRKFKRCHKVAATRVEPGRVSPMRLVPAGIARPPYAETGEVERRAESGVQTAEVIERMRVAGRVAAEVL